MLQCQLNYCSVVVPLSRVVPKALLCVEVSTDILSDNIDSDSLDGTE